MGRETGETSWRKQEGRNNPLGLTNDKKGRSDVLSHLPLLAHLGDPEVLAVGVLDPLEAL